MWLYIALGFAIDITVTFYLIPNKFEKAWLGNIYLILEFIFISLYFKSQLKVHLKNYWLFFVLITSIVFIWRTVLKSIFLINLTDASIFRLIFIAYGIAGFYIMLKEQKVLQLETSECFWANVAFIVYFAGTFTLFLFYDLVKEQQKLVQQLWVIILLSLNVIYRLLLTVAITRKND